MYQSFPQRHISKSVSAMPIVKEASVMPSESEKTDFLTEKEEKTQNSKKMPTEKTQSEKEDTQHQKSSPTDFLQSLSLDDIIIIGLIILLIYEGSEDYLTIGLLAAVLLF